MQRLTSVLLVLLSAANAKQLTSLCTFASLEATIGNSSAGDVIVFDCPNDNHIDFENHLFLEHSLTIDGALEDGSVVVLDGQGDYRQFQVAWKDVRWGMQCPTCEVLLKNLRFENGGGSTVYIKEANEPRNDGGCVYVGQYGALKVHGCDFVECRTEGTPNEDTDTTFRGGAIATAYDTKFLTIVSSTFCNCFATQTGGAVSTYWLNYNTTVIDCVFRGNEAMTETEAGGGALYLPNTIATIKDSVFANNRAHMGGAIFSISTDLMVENSLFANNSLFKGEEVGNSVAHGAAIYTDGTARTGNVDGAQHLWQLTDCVFENNEGVASGGAIFVCLYDSNPGSGQVEGCNFTGNSVNEYDQNGDATVAAAMAYYCAGTMSMDRVLMSGNKPSTQLNQWSNKQNTFGAWVSAGKFTVTDSTIPGWAATGGRNITEDTGPALKNVFDEAEMNTICTPDDGSKSAAPVQCKLVLVACFMLVLTFNM